MSLSAENRVLSDRYRITDRLGSGGTADVFRAHDEHLDRDVAIKVFRVPPTEDDPLFSTARRDAELQSLARLNHPNLTRLLDGSVSPDEPAYLVLDLVCGPDLATRLHDGPLPEDEVRTIGGQIAAALDYAHGTGMVHRDVKPANVLIGDDGPDGGVWARLSDFGTVRMVDGARLTAADLTLGTASYIAPEQARGSDVGPAADVYSLGLVLIEALTGERCFPGTTPEALQARLASTPVVPDWLPADLVALLTAMTDLDPGKRPSAAAVAEQLLVPVPPDVAAAADAEDTSALRAIEPEPAAAAADDVESEPEVFAEDAPPPRVRHRGGVLLALAGLAFAAIVAGGAFLLMGNTAPSDSQTPLVPQHSVQPTHSQAHARTTDAGAEVFTRPSGATGTHHRSQPSRSAANPARSATRTATQSTSPAATSSSAPTSSAAPSSSSPASSTSAPSSTSPAPTTSATSSPAPPPSP